MSERVKGGIDMKRRAFLAGLAATGVVGCSSGSGDGASPLPRTSTTTPRALPNTTFSTSIADKQIDGEDLWSVWTGVYREFRAAGLTGDDGPAFDSFVQRIHNSEIEAIVGAREVIALERLSFGNSEGGSDIVEGIAFRAESMIGVAECQGGPDLFILSNRKLPETLADRVITEFELDAAVDSTISVQASLHPDSPGWPYAHIWIIEPTHPELMAVVQAISNYNNSIQEERPHILCPVSPEFLVRDGKRSPLMRS